MSQTRTILAGAGPQSPRVIRENVSFLVAPFAETLLAGARHDMRFAGRPGWKSDSETLFDRSWELHR